MSAERAPLAACPACVMPHDAADIALPPPAPEAIRLSLPTIHCAACISAVERALSEAPGVRQARVNLTLRRAQIDAAPGVTAAALIDRLTAIGFEAHELDAGTLAVTETDRAGRNLLMRLAVAGFASMNVMLLSVAVWSGAEGATRDLMHWVSAMIALPTVAFSAQPFFISALSALSVRRLNMDVPISLAILLASGMSLYETMQGGAHAYFDAALSLTFFLLAGRYLDHRTRASARSAASELAALEVPRAWRLIDGDETEVPISALQIGDLVRVRPGGRMPVDGVVEHGTSEVDRAFLTGESLPAFAGPGDVVSAGEVNLTGPLTLRVTARGQDTTLHKIADLVALAETARNRYTSLADRAAEIYAPGVHLLALFALAGWMLASGDFRYSLNIAIAVLIITCPCALGLAVPAVTTAASGRLFRRGVLLKNATALERLAEVDNVVFDKTGTLTLGSPDLIAPERHARTDLAVAGALAQGSSHPLAQALARTVRDLGHDLAEVGDIREVPGYGIEGRWAGRRVRLGRASWLGLETPADAGTSTWLKIGDAAPVAFGFSDALRPGALAAVAALKAAGMQVLLVSGDTEAAVAATARAAGIGIWVSGALPQDKVARVTALTAAGSKVLMVGDGLNDTGALAAAHVSISPASAIDAARTASDIVILGRDLEVLGECLAVARAARRRILENFGVAAVYNLVAIPIALAGFATPLAAALAMSGSSIMVSLNALRLR